ncbi:MAG: 2-succinyl-5-enolpyruvyl-6-hydroxy-3-cyclohexene-1-carboxylic-acid synthase [Acidimicrobiales bacterium]
MSVVQATFAATLVDEWVRAGVTDAVVCPGSRSTPLALAIAARPELTVHVRLDERGAGFFALGLALATGRPAPVCVTSGTAAAELHAAVVEAHHARVPMLVCTADRPPELHDVGAPQTIEQSGIYGTTVRWAAAPGVPVEEAAGTWRSLAARALAEATAGPLGPGPIHLNLAFRDPLVGEPGPLPDARPDGGPWHRVAVARAEPDVGDWPDGRGVVVAGAGSGPPDAVLAFAERAGWPVLADPRSGCRLLHPNVVAAADAIARGMPAHLRPDVVVRLGARWASKALPSFLAGARVLAVDPWWRWEDPDRSASVVERCQPGEWLDAACRAAPPRPPSDWLPAWQRAERLAQGAIDAALAVEGLCEPVVARRLAAALPQGSTVVVSSSMPVRDLEWFSPASQAPPRVLANRGANGIDGVCSTALGVAAAGGGPVVAVVGDLAFFHDLSALVAAADAAPAGCTIVVVDNGGGGIFELLPQATALRREVFERFFGTPQSPDVVRAAEGLGVRCADVGTPEELDVALGAAVSTKELSVVRARVPARPGNAAVHARLHAALSAALG